MKKRSKLMLAGMATLMLGLLFPGAGISALPVKPAPAQPAPSAPSAVPADSSLIFRYDPTGKPDPFKPFVDTEIALKKKKAEELLRQQKQQKVKAQALSIFPLQRLSLDQYKLVGIGGNSRNRTAMVQDPAGKFYPVFIGSLMGLHGAKVIEIRESSVLLEEVLQVVSEKSKKKRIEKKRIELRLHREGEEGKP